MTLLQCHHILHECHPVAKIVSLALGKEIPHFNPCHASRHLQSQMDKSWAEGGGKLTLNKTNKGRVVQGIAEWR